MTKGIGVWIDHRRAVVVCISEMGEEVKIITSEVDKHVRHSVNPSEPGSAEDVRDRQYQNHLNSYYDTIINSIHDGDSIQVFGPGEAKGELAKRLEKKTHGQPITCVDTVGKMTDGQISAKVREGLRNMAA